jgi:hypothetical protein
LLAFVRLYLDKRPDEAIAQLSGFDKTRQDLLLGLLSLATGLTEGDPTKINDQQVGLILNQLSSIAAPLRQKAPLVLSSGTLCKSVREFGVYEPLPPDFEFLHAGFFQIYVEVQNFSSVHHEGNYEIWLLSSADFFDAEGRPVPNTHIDFNVADTAHTTTLTPRREYNRVYSANLPEALGPGRYTLRLQVKDVPTQRTAVKTFNLTVGALGRRL